MTDLYKLRARFEAELAISLKASTTAQDVVLTSVKDLEDSGAQALSVLDDLGREVEILYEWSEINTSTKTLVNCKRRIGGGCDKNWRVQCWYNEAYHDNLETVLGEMETSTGGKIAKMDSPTAGEFVLQTADGEIEPAGSGPDDYATDEHLHDDRYLTGAEVLSAINTISILTTFDMVIDAADGGDYTSLEAGFAASSEGQRILVRAGLYEETGNWGPKDNQHVVFDPSNGGVRVINTGCDMRLNDSSSGNLTTATGTISGSDITWPGSPDLSDVENFPENYKLGIRGRLYDIDECVDSTDTITVDGTPPVASAGAEWLYLLHQPTIGLVMEGKLSVVASVAGTRSVLAYAMANCDFSELDWFVGGQGFILYAVDCDFGRIDMDASDSLAASGDVTFFRIDAASKLRLRLAISGAPFYDAYNRVGLLMGVASGVRVELPDLDLMIRDLANASTGVSTGVKTNNSGYLVDGVFRGVCIGCNTNTTNLTNCNTAGLKAS